MYISVVEKNLMDHSTGYVTNTSIDETQAHWALDKYSLTFSLEHIINTKFNNHLVHKTWFTNIRKAETKNTCLQ